MGRQPFTAVQHTPPKHRTQTPETRHDLQTSRLGHRLTAYGGRERLLPSVAAFN